MHIIIIPIKHFLWWNEHWCCVMLLTCHAVTLICPGCPVGKDLHYRISPVLWPWACGMRSYIQTTNMSFFFFFFCRVGQGEKLGHLDECLLLLLILWLKELVELVLEICRWRNQGTSTLKAILRKTKNMQEKYISHLAWVWPMSWTKPLHTGVCQVVKPATPMTWS